MLIDIFNKDWENHGIIGEGSLGVIYLLQKKNNHKKRVFKLIKKQFSQNKFQIKSAFLSISQISHENCVRLYDWVENDLEFGFSMEYVEGKTLRDIYPISLEKILNIFTQIATGLSALHQSGIVHRDLKPTNILIGNNNSVKISDFDLIKFDNVILKAETNYFGTIKYSSPEQINNALSIDLRSDLYSLGIMLYEAFTGKVPFDGLSWEEIALQHQNKIPNLDNKKIPIKLKSMLKKLLEKNPAERYDNASDIVVILKTYLNEILAKKELNISKNNNLKTTMSNLTDIQRSILKIILLTFDSIDLEALVEMVNANIYNIKKAIDELIKIGLIIQIDHEFKVNKIEDIIQAEIDDAYKKDAYIKFLNYYMADSSKEESWSKIAYFSYQLNDIELTKKYIDKAIAFNTSQKRYSTLTRLLKYKSDILKSEQKPLDEILDINYDIAKYYFKLSNFPKAIEHILSIFKDLNETICSEKIYSLKNLLAQIYYEIRDFDKSIATLEECKNIFIKEQNDLKIQEINGNLGNIYFALKLFDKAEVCFLEKINFLKKEKNESYYQTIFNLAVLKHTEGKLSNAKKYFNSCLKYYIKQNNEPLMAYCWQAMSVISKSKGNYDDGILYMENAIKISKKKDDLKSLSENYYNIANLYTSKGQFQKAIDYLKKAIPLFEKANDNQSICMVYNGLGVVYKDLNFFKKAEIIFKKAIKIAESHNFENELGAIYYNIAEIFFERDSNLKKANEYNKKSLELVKKLKREEKILLCEILQAKIDYKKCKNIENKNKIILNLLQMLSKTENDKTKAAIYYELHKMTQSELYKKESLQLLKKLYKKSPTYSYKKAILELNDDKKASSDVPLPLLNSLIRFMNPETAYSELLNFLTLECKADNCQIVKIDKYNDLFETLALSDNLDSDDLDFSESIIKERIKNNDSVLIPNAVEVEKFQNSQSIIGKPFLSVIAVPLNYQNQSLGALYLDRRQIKNGGFIQKDLEKVKLIGNILAPVIIKQDQFQNYRIQMEVKKFGNFIGESSAMNRMYKSIFQAANAFSTVYINGDSGTGKELVAKSIHALSKQNKNRFVVLNCAAIPAELAESELFGYEKGAFTGASSRKKGKFELANGGTLFLDEIGELSMNIQAKLLRVLQENEITRLGGEYPMPIKTRIIVATHKNLQKEVEIGNFRQDLFHRLNILEIKVPTLNEHKEDIPLLTEYFIKQISEQNNRPNPGISENALETLISHNWENNNIRELRNTIERAFIRHDSDFPISANEFFPPSKGKIKIDSHELANIFGSSLDETIRALEKKILLDVLEKHNWNKSKAATELNIGRPRIDRIIKREKIENKQ